MGRDVVVVGIPSGDCECWCLLVDEATFRRVCGREPEADHDLGPFAGPGSPFKWMVHPGDLVGYENGGKTLSIRLQVTEV